MIEDSSLTTANENGRAVAKPEDMMKASDVFIAYNLDDSDKVSAVLITDDPDVWRRRNEAFDATGGKCYADWCVPLDQRDNGIPPFAPDQCFDPTGVYGTILSHGFSSRRALRETLKQFAAIDTCDWARRMLFAIDGEWEDETLNRPY